MHRTPLGLLRALGLIVGVDAYIDPHLSGHFPMLTAARGQAALQHHRRLSLELVGGGVYDAPFQRAVDKRQPLQGLQNALGLVVGAAICRPPSTDALPYVDGRLLAAPTTVDCGFP